MARQSSGDLAVAMTIVGCIFFAAVGYAAIKTVYGWFQETATTRELEISG